MRPTEAVIDLAALQRNIQRMVAHVAPAHLCAVTKANAYGHGAVQCSLAALQAGATWLAVALVEEGRELRSAGIEAPILLLSEPTASAMSAAVAADLTLTLYSDHGIALAAAVAREQGVEASVHLNVDTGMHRVGVAPGNALSAVREIGQASHLRFTGIWTHFAVADEPGRPETQHQLDLFASVLDDLAPHIDDTVIVHASNSAGLLILDHARFDMVRTGISAYGIEPAPGVNGGTELDPVLSLRSELSYLKSVKAGDTISYGLAHTFAHDTTVGTVPIGYADGVRRSSFARGVPMLVGGERRPIVGVVTMDQTMIDLGPDSTAVVGDEVVIVGRQGDEHLAVNDIATQLDTIGYEVVCAISSRVPRRFVN